MHHFLAEAEKGPVEPREGLFQSREKSTKSIGIDDLKMGDILSVIVCIYINIHIYIYYNFLIGTTYFLAHFSSELLSPPKTLRDVGSYESLHFPAQDLGHPQLSQAIPVIKTQRLPGDTKQPKNDTLIGKTK